MRKFILIILISFLSLMPLNAKAPVKSNKPIPVEVQKPAEDTISSEDLKATVAHIQSLAREQQAELDKATAENKAISNELTLANKNTDTLQKQVNQVTDDRNLQAKLKDDALNQLDILKAQIIKLNKEIRKLKTIIAGEAFLIVLLGCLAIGLPKFSFPYGLIGCIILPSLVFSAVYFWL